MMLAFFASVKLKLKLVISTYYENDFLWQRQKDRKNNLLKMKEETFTSIDVTCQLTNLLFFDVASSLVFVFALLNSI